MTPAALAALKALAEGATPLSGIARHSLVCRANLPEADARYIAAASPDVVLALVAEVERLREALRRIAVSEDAGNEQAHDWPEFWASVQERAREALAGGEPEPPVVVDGECMQDCDAMGLPCPKRGATP